MFVPTVGMTLTGQDVSVYDELVPGYEWHELNGAEVTITGVADMLDPFRTMLGFSERVLVVEGLMGRVKVSTLFLPESMERIEGWSEDNSWLFD